MKFVAIILALSVASCHGFITGPFLLNHGSSAAFDLMIGLWIICGLLIFIALNVGNKDEK